MDVLGLMIGHEDHGASDGAVFERRNPMSGDVATRAAAATMDDAIAAADAAAAAFPAWSQTAPKERRAILLKAADLLQSRADDFVKAMAGEIGATAGWARFNVGLAADMLREAASLTTQITGEVIPSDTPRLPRHGASAQPAGVVLSHRALERAGDPRRARAGDAAGLRQHGGAEGLRDLPAARTG